MKPETEYRYQKRIKNLNRRIDELIAERNAYRSFAYAVYDVMADLKPGESMNRSWFFRRAKDLWWWS